MSMQCWEQMIRTADEACTGMKNIRTRRCIIGIRSSCRLEKTHACIVEGEMIETITNDDDDTIVMIRKNGDETIAMLFNCGNSAKEFNEYAEKHNLLTDSAFDGKVDGLDAAIIVL